MHAPAIEVVRVEARLHRAAGLVGRVMLLVLGHRGDSERVEGRGSHRVFGASGFAGVVLAFVAEGRVTCLRCVGDPVMIDSF